MDKEIISNKQGIATMVMFIVGSTMVLGVGGEAKQDAWIAGMIGMFMSVPFIFVYARTLKLFPGKNLYDILESLYGKMFGKAITAIYVWYSIHLGALVLRNFSEYIQIVSMPETPQFVLTMFLGTLGIYSVKSGIEVIGRWSILVLTLCIVSIIFIDILSITQMDISNLKPILYNGLKPVLKSAFTVFSFPFAETVLFMTVLGGLNNRGSSYKTYYISLIFGGIILILSSIRNITVLGIGTALTLYFPVHGAISLIDIGDFLERVEVVISVIYLLAGIVKVSICLYSASIGFAKLFDFKDYRKVVFPMAVTTMNLSCIIYKNTMEMFQWAIEIYKYYAIPFQVIIPLAILITAEIKTRSAKNRQITS